MENGLRKRRIAIVGLGYVGLPVATAFAEEGFDTIGYDIDRKRISELQSCYDRTLEVTPEELSASHLIFSTDPMDLALYDFFIVTVPTPIDSCCQPDLEALIAASRMIGKLLKNGDIVVYESTVYPGVTENVCTPELESVSGLKSQIDFYVGYSPERINPGDKQHSFKSIVKVVSAQDHNTATIIAATYRAVVTAGIHIAPSIKVAEAAKLIENAQRDINIAFMNEVSEIFRRLNIDTSDVLTAASTKWNFLKFTPGLVGGHCISVDPYYLTYQAHHVGYRPEVILAGRRINDKMGQSLATECVKMMLRQFQKIGRVVQLGITFKENIPDLRNSLAATIVRELNNFGIDVDVVDPLASPVEALKEYGIDLCENVGAQQAKAVILAVAHDSFKRGGWNYVSSFLKDGVGIVIDVKSTLDRTTKPEGITLLRL